MEPDVIRIYSSSPPPMEDAGEDEEDEFSDFTSVPNSTSFSEFDTPTTFNQSQALNATSPPELLSNGRIVGLSSQSAGCTKANGVAPAAGQTNMPNGRTVGVEELKKLTEHQTHIISLEFPTSSRTDNDCNGTVEVLTNGFASLEPGASPPTPHKNNKSDDDFADFSAFSNAEHDQPSNTDWELSNQGCRVALNDVSNSVEYPNQGCRLAQTDVSDIVGEHGDSLEGVSTTGGFGLPSERSEGLSNGDLGFHEGSDLDQRDLETNTTEIVSTSLTLNGVARSESNDNSVSPNGEICIGGQSDEKGSETEETETETSFGRPLSTEALEEFGDFSTTGSVPSPLLQEETATPADHSQLAEDDDDEDFGDFGDFGDANAFSAGSFADFDQQGAETQVTQPKLASEKAEDDEFGDFDISKELSKTDLPAEEATMSADFPGSDSFADFSSAQGNDGGDDGGWQAFSEPDQSQNGEESWATFGQAQDEACTEKSGDNWQQDTTPPTGAEERKICTSTALVSRLGKIFQVSFEPVVSPQVEDEVNTLHSFLKPPSEEQDGGRGQTSLAVRDVWQQLQDVNNAFGLRYQWGGSHTNKALLCSLGIDTRNILFTGHKKQPVIVPMYAASLGMLEPTKEPVKPVSAAEMIASIAQSPSVATELSSCPPDNTQESLPPVQFDWSSSGLTNPLDASGGSSLLNLDFFGPVDESPSGTATSIPGVDPELYELTQVKLEVSGGSIRVVDAFARLMSTVEKTSTSTRKPVQKEENLSLEAQQVISGLPDLSFMQAKVLMFPSTLTPLLPSSSTPD